MCTSRYSTSIDVHIQRTSTSILVELQILKEPPVKETGPKKTHFLEVKHN